VIDLFLFFRISALSRQHTTLKGDTEATVLVGLKCAFFKNKNKNKKESNGQI
jgi:hypothetical protein